MHKFGIIDDAIILIQNELFSYNEANIGKSNSLQTEAGLCARCLHARRTISKHGGTFILCKLAEIERRFPKYPLLPILSCEGYQLDLKPNLDSSV
jgi:hypothetical protein